MPTQTSHQIGRFWMQTWGNGFKQGLVGLLFRRFSWFLWPWLPAASRCSLKSKSYFCMLQFFQSCSHSTNCLRHLGQDVTLARVNNVIDGYRELMQQNVRQLPPGSVLAWQKLLTYTGSCFRPLGDVGIPELTGRETRVGDSFRST